MGEGRPHGQWEWSVEVHKPGDRQHVTHLLPRHSLSSEKAVKDYVVTLLDKYDMVRLYHFTTLTELTFRLGRTGRVITSRRTFTP